MTWPVCQSHYRVVCMLITGEAVSVLQAAATAFPQAAQSCAADVWSTSELGCNIFAITTLGRAFSSCLLHVVHVQEPKEKILLSNHSLADGAAGLANEVVVF